MSTFWDQRYSGTVFAYGEQPNAFLKKQAYLLKPGMKALAVGDGEGRNGVWLAQLGLRVLSLDRSTVGLSKARSLARWCGVSLLTEEADLLTWQWPEEEFDAVVSIFLHFASPDRERMHRAFMAALKPQGTLILVAFTPEQLSFNTGGPEQRELLYTAETLRHDFSGMNISWLREIVAPLNEGVYHHGMGAMVQLVASKLASSVQP